MKSALLLLLVVLGPATTNAWSYQTNFDGGNWINGPILIEVDTTGATAVGSADPSTLFEAVTAAAAKWNAALKWPVFRVAPATIPSRSEHDGQNQLVFSSSISSASAFATQFGSVAIERSPTGCLREADTIFNPSHRWRVYRGPLQHEMNGNRVPDLYRVALHEFGHLLGLVHPDSDAEVTIMRSKMSDVDDLTPRDIRDASYIIDGMFSRNRPRVDFPKGTHARTTARKIALRGTATPFFARNLVVKIHSAGHGRIRTFRLAAKWKKSLLLATGLNRLRFYYHAPGGRLEFFSTKTVFAR